MTADDGMNLKRGHLKKGAVLILSASTLVLLVLHPSIPWWRALVFKTELGSGTRPGCTPAVMTGVLLLHFPTFSGLSLASALARVKVVSSPDKGP